NPHYWAQQIPWLEAYPDKLIYRNFTGIAGTIAALKSQELDLTTINTNDFLHGFDSGKWSFIKKDTIYTSSYNYIAINTQHPILSSKKVRQAIAMLVNRDLILKKLSYGLGKKIESPVTPIQPGWD